MTSAASLATASASSETSTASGVTTSASAETSTASVATTLASGEISTASMATTLASIVTSTASVGTASVSIETSTAPVKTTMAVSETSTAPATSTQTTITKPMIPTAEPALICQNGGLVDGTKCICQEEFYGPHCEFATDVIDGGVSTVTAEVEVQVKVTNRNFSDTLKDKASSDYIIFEFQFKKQMQPFYENVPGYKDVAILSLGPGSIVVNHSVIIEARLSNDLNATFQEATKAVVKQLEVANTTTPNCTVELCFMAPPNPILKDATSNFSAADFCAAKVSADFAKYYYPVITASGSLRCVTKCSQDLPDFLNCNHGQCQLQVTGPQCACSSTDMFWYQDSNCLTRISKVGVGMAVPMVALIIAGIVLTICLVRTRKKRSLVSLGSSLEQLEDYEEEMSVSGGIIIKNDAASHYGSSGSGSFTPHLSAVDPAIPMHIRRPKIINKP